MITVDDWNKNMQFDHNNAKFRELVNYVKVKKLQLSKVLALLGMEGVRKVSVFTLKEGLMKLWPGLSEEDALLLSKFIAKGKEEIEVEKVIDALNITDNNQVEADSEWEERFLGRLKRKLNEKRTTEEELLSKFKLYDHNNNGYIEQTDFKTVLGDLGISLNLT